MISSSSWSVHIISLINYNLTFTQVAEALQLFDLVSIQKNEAFKKIAENAGEKYINEIVQLVFQSQNNYTSKFHCRRNFSIKNKLDEHKKRIRS